MIEGKLPAKDKKLVIVGSGPFAEVACELFDADSRYDVIGFSVERPFLKTDALLGRPVVAFEDVGKRFPPAEHDVYVAIVYTQLNRLRTRLLKAAKRLGYPPASYISTDARVWRNVEVGEHCFIGENTVVHPFASVGDNVILWSGNHLGHHSRVRENVFVAPHGVIAGHCDIGRNTFVGANASVGDNVVVAPDCWIGAGASIVTNTKEGEIYRAGKRKVGRITAPSFFKVKD